MLLTLNFRVWLYKSLPDPPLYMLVALTLSFYR
jgi:hypothetical protein